MIEIRPLKKDDKFDDLIALSKEFFYEHESHNKEFFKIDNIHGDDIIKYFSKWIDRDDGETFIAVTEGKIVGYITVYIASQERFWKIKQIGKMSGFMVQKAHRRKGIARQLFSEGKSFFEMKGIKYFTLFTSVNNTGALKFYKECGMIPLHTTLMGEINL